MTKIINLIGGPSIGKSVTANKLFSLMKTKNISVEYVPEYAKELVYNENFELLNNQHYVTYIQYKRILKLIDKVDYIITDSPIILGLIYNIIYPNNVCDIDKTEEAILKWHSEFNNINILIERNPNHTYEEEGRLQKYEEALHIDNLINKYIKKYNISFKKYLNNKKIDKNILKYILKEEGKSNEL